MSKQIPPIEDKDLIYGISFTALHLSLLGSIFVIGRVVYRWKKEGSKPITLRFPLYIAITDILMYIICMADQLHNVLFGNDWEGDLCTFIAAVVGFAAATNCILVACISVQVYFSTILKSPLDFGTHDWKLILFIICTSLAVEGIAYKSNGQSWYWCYETMYSPDKTLPILSVVVESSLFSVILFCGLKVLLQIRRVKNSKMKQVQNSNKLVHSKSTEFTRSVAAKAQDEDVLDRTLAIPYVIGGIFNYYHKYIILVAVLGFSTGGIWNMIGFIINEGWYDKKTTHKKLSNHNESMQMRSIAKKQDN
ncbi:hypothetical protein HDV06_002666 [Boothiomyces sp. JEL0866]|nr:hypothetical protein HDV06_002666 [Boothiomyces sp. JEL0866]